MRTPTKACRDTGVWKQRLLARMDSRRVDSGLYRAGKGERLGTTFAIAFWPQNISSRKSVVLIVV